MDKSKVYFTDFRARYGGTPIPEKFEKLLAKAGLDEIDFKGKLVAIKLNFGEEGNMAYLRHNYARSLAGMIRARGGRPFLTDCNTLYVGSRKNAVDHLECACSHGYNALTCGCDVIIADGLRGLDERLIKLDGEYVKEAKIGSAIAEADIVISLSHFKGHEMSGFGGAIKNLGMGSASRAGKMEQHCFGKPEIDESLCVCCRRCSTTCAQDAISYDTGKAVIDHDRCVGCGRCIGICPTDAVGQGEPNSIKVFNCRMAEYALAVCKGKPNFHISVVCDVSPFCDCHPENDQPIIPDVGMFAGFDPVALDRACADACNSQPALEGSLLEEAHSRGHCGGDSFLDVTPDSDWRSGLEHCEKIGLGSQQYELVTLK